MVKKSITERENALRALRGTASPEWIPIFNDAVQIVVSSGTGERPHDKEGLDWFGCPWVFDEKSMGYAPDLRKPYLLEDIADWREVVRFPDLDSIDFEAAAERDMADVDREQKVVRLFMETGPLERANAIMGFEGVCIAMYEDPDELKAFFDAISDFKARLLDILIPLYRPDEIFTQDDLGSGNAPLMSMDLYRRILKPSHETIAKTILSHGVLYDQHTDGVIGQYIDDLVGIGMSVLNPVQRCNDRMAIARKYGDKLSFDVGVDSVNFPVSTEEDIRKEVREIIDIFGPTKRAMLNVFPSNVDTLGNVDIALDEAREYGGSFYQGK